VNNQTSIYDLSLVILGASGNTIQLSNTYTKYTPYSLFQSTNSNSNYSYYVSKSSSIQTIGANFSVSAWVYPYTNSQPGIIWCLSDASYNNYITLTLNANPTQWQIIITIVSNGNVTYSGSPGLSSSNAWYNLTLTCSYSGGVSTVQIYKNGTLVSGYVGAVGGNKDTLTLNSQLFNASSNVSLYVMGGPVGTTSGPTSPNLAWGGLNYANGTLSNGFICYLSNLNVFNSTLNQTQVNTVNSSVPNQTLGGLGGLIKCGSIEGPQTSLLSLSLIQTISDFAPRDYAIVGNTLYILTVFGDRVNTFNSITFQSITPSFIPGIGGGGGMD
jgi:hypothetical protein